MSLSMSQVSVPVFVRALSNLRGVLQLGEAFATERGIAPDVLLQQRLIVDMLPLLRQVQIATDMAKNGCARLAGVEPLPFPDEEADFAGTGVRAFVQAAVGDDAGTEPSIDEDGRQARGASAGAAPSADSAPAPLWSRVP